MIKQIDRKTLNSFIQSGNLEKAVPLFVEQTRSTKLEQEAVSISSQYNSYKKKSRRGIISDEQATLERNKITDRLLEAINLPEEEVMPDTPKKEVPDASKENKSKKNILGWVSLIATIIASLVGVLLSGYFDLRPEQYRYLIQVETEQEHVSKLNAFILKTKDETDSSPFLKSEIGDNGNPIFLSRKKLAGKSYFIDFAESQARNDFQIVNNPVKVIGELITVKIERIVSSASGEITSEDGATNAKEDPEITRQAPTETEKFPSQNNTSNSNDIKRPFKFEFFGSLNSEESKDRIANADIFVEGKKIGTTDSKGNFSNLVLELENYPTLLNYSVMVEGKRYSFTPKIIPKRKKSYRIIDMGTIEIPVQK